MDKKGVGIRLKEFGKNKFGKLDLFAEALSMSPQSLQSYLSGRSLPGAAIISKLIELGCDTNWLLGIENYKDAVTVSENNNGKDLYEIKDKIIIQQAEEIFKLKQLANDLEQRLKDLERRIKEESKPVKKVVVRK